MFIWIVWAGAVLILIAINNSPNFLVRIWNPKVAVVRLGHMSCPIRSCLVFFIWRVRSTIRYDGLHAANGLPKMSHIHIQQHHMWMILLNWQFCLLWKRHTQSLYNIHLMTLARKLHSVLKKYGKCKEKYLICQRKLLANHSSHTHIHRSRSKSL